MMVRVLLAACVTAVFLSFQACSGGDGFGYRQSPNTTGNGKGGFVNANGGTTTDNPKPTLSLEVGEFEATGPASGIYLCIDEVRFRNAFQELRAEFRPKWIALDAAGTLIDANLTIPPGQYERIELHQSDRCDGLAATVVNPAGIFNLTSDFTIRFSGAVAVGNNSRAVLDMSGIISAVNKATNQGQVLDAFTSSEGGCGGN